MPQLAVQMFTVRDFTSTAHELAETLTKIRAIGYQAVQMSAVGAMTGEHPPVDAVTARRMLDDCGLRCIGTHRSWDDLAANTAAEIDFHHTLGCDFVAISTLPREHLALGAEGYVRFADESAAVIARLKAEGIRFACHNHAFDFVRTGSGRHTAFDVLIDAANRDLLIELDVYWAHHAGHNPERLLERCAGRVPVIHVKDKEVAGRDAVMAPIGEGNLDWEGILPVAARAGVEWIAVEQDICRRDPFDCLRSSYEYLAQSPTITV